MSSRPVVLATTSSFGGSAPEAVKRVEAAGFALQCNPFGRKLTEDELLELVRDHAPVGLLAGTEPVTRTVLEAAAPALKAVARVGVGWDNVDHEAAGDLGIPVSRTEGVLDQAVAELTLGMILGALRHVPVGDRDIRNGVWKKRMGSLLAGRTVGILGFGAIGQRVGTFVHALGASVVYYDPADVAVDWAMSAPFEEVLRQADVLTIHASGGACLMDGDALATFAKPGAIIVNTARGGMIDEEALAAALTDGRIGYACLDVFENEPYTGPLAELENVVMTPHIGSYALEARVAMETAAVNNLLKTLGR